MRQDFTLSTFIKTESQGESLKPKPVALQNLKTEPTCKAAAAARLQDVNLSHISLFNQAGEK